MKANKEGWIRHRSGKCPVEAGTLVDVRFRSGIIKTVCDSLSLRWSHSGALGDIMAYRLHTPSEQPETVKECLPVDPVVASNVDAFNAQAEMPAAKYFDGPLQWRDRIFEIDKQSAELKQERIELVQKLASEGLQLTGCPF